MICVEVPLRTIRDQINALESATEPGPSEAFAAGAMAALAWIFDPKNNHPPVQTMLDQWCKKSTVQ